MNVRPTYAEIDLEAVKHNIIELKRKVAPAKLMAVVKADAYGHGMEKVAGISRGLAVEYFGVALLEEGIQLREYVKNTPILVFGGFFEDQIEDFLGGELDLTVFDLNLATKLSRLAGRRGVTARVHVKVDTGMSRVGLNNAAAVGLIAQIMELKNLRVQGLYTHFAASDSKDKTSALQQLDRFRQLVDQLNRMNIEIPLKHIANSGAILDLPESYFDLVRAGICIYGCYPSRETTESLELQPVLSLRSRIIAVKDVAAETKVSYGGTYTTNTGTRLAIIPIGYADGYSRLLSNRADVLIHGHRYPVVGNVCMDQLVVDAGSDGRVKLGDEVVLLGRQGENEISVYELCGKLDTIPYEIITRVSQRVPRVYKSN